MTGMKLASLNLRRQGSAVYQLLVIALQEAGLQRLQYSYQAIARTVASQHGSNLGIMPLRPHTLVI